MRVIIALLMVMISMASIGQETKTKKTIAEKGKEMTDEFNKKIELDKDQYVEIEEIYKNYLKEKRELSKAIKELEKKKKEIKKNRNDKIYSVLNTEQKKRLDLQKAKKKRRNKKN